MSPKVADELGKLAAFDEAEKLPALEKLLGVQAAANEATAVRQAQRAGTSPEDAATVAQLAAAFAQLSEAQATLRQRLLTKQRRMLGPTRELERLRRGCQQAPTATSCAPLVAPPSLPDLAA